MDIPAKAIAHWVTGPVYCCLKHALGLQLLGKTLGVHVHIEPYDGEDEVCGNCENQIAKTGEDQDGERTD